MWASMASAANDWVTTSRDMEYPNDFYFVGVGMSERGVDIAKQNAMVEVKKQLSVSVSASMLDEQSAISINGKGINASRVESRARLVTSGDVSGIEVVKSAQQGKLFYALAVLDKKNFIAATKAKIADLKKQVSQLVAAIQTDISANKMAAALVKLSVARKNIILAEEQRTLLSAAAPPTDAEKLDVTLTDISLLFEKCVAGIRLSKTGGDNQVFAVGMVPSDPFVVTASVEGGPVPSLQINLLDDNNKIALTRFTDDNGKAEFSVSEKADMSAGTHKYTAAIFMNVGSELKTRLAAQNQIFAYTVQSNPCFAKILVDVSAPLTSGKEDIAKKVIARLSKYDVKNDPASESIIKVSVAATETGNVAGLSENNSFVKTEVSLTLALTDEDGKDLASLTGTGKGMGSTLVKSTIAGIDNVKLEGSIKTVLEKICSVKSIPTLKIAVFEFKDRTGYAWWYDMAQGLTDMLTTQLINSGKFDVVERTQINRIMEEKSLAQSGIVEENEAIQIAKVANADVILIGTASIAGSKIEADARIVDMKTGIAKCAMSSSSYSLSDLRLMATEIVGQLKSKCWK